MLPASDLAFVGFSAYQSESTSRASVGQAFPADTLLLDINSNFDTSTYKFTAPVTGYYEFTFTMNGANGQQSSLLH